MTGHPGICIQRCINPQHLILMHINRNHTDSISAAHRRGPNPLSLALHKDHKWPNGCILRVRILNGSDEITRVVRLYANEWTKHANIKFEFVVSGDAEIRVKIVSDGNSWSYVGTQNRCIPQTEPTMHLRFDCALPETAFSASILHEFGHALGCVHEHQSPVNGIQWDREAVYSLHSGVLSREEVEFNIFTAYSSSSTQYSEFDPASIMLYPIDPSMTVNGFSVQWNTQLSDTDKAFIARKYPHNRYPCIVSFNTNTFLSMDPELTGLSQAVERRRFPITCIRPPTLAVGLNSFSFGKGDGIRVATFANNTTASTTDICIRAWGKEQPDFAGCTWFPDGPALHDPDFQIGQFSARDDPCWRRQPRPNRSMSVCIPFKRHYDSPPKVVIWLNELNVQADGKVLRVVAKETDVTAESFRLHIAALEDTILDCATVAWIAYPRGKRGVFSGTYSIRDVRPSTRSQPHTSGCARFPTNTFQRPPMVLCAFNELNVDARQNMCVELGVQSVSKDRMSWCIDSRYDTVLHSAGASYIAFT